MSWAPCTSLSISHLQLEAGIFEQTPWNWVFGGSFGDRPREDHLPFCYALRKWAAASTCQDSCIGDSAVVCVGYVKDASQAPGLKSVPSSLISLLQDACEQSVNKFGDDACIEYMQLLLEAQAAVGPYPQ